MSVYDGLTPQTPLPAIDEATGSRIQHVQDTGETWRLATTDEAGLAAIGLENARRDGREEIPEEAIAEAADRLVAEGLAEPTPWHFGRVRPIGGLLVYSQLVLNQKTHHGLIMTWATPASAGTMQRQFKISVLTDALRAGQAAVECREVPTEVAPASVPVTVDVLRLDVLVTMVVAAAFGDDDSGVPRETVVAFAGSRGELEPSRIRVDAHGQGELESTRHGLLRGKTVRQGCDREGFADHLKERLMSAG